MVNFAVSSPLLDGATHFPGVCSYIFLFVPISMFLIEFLGLVKVCFLSIQKVAVIAVMSRCHDFIKSYQAKRHCLYH